MNQLALNYLKANYKSNRKGFTLIEILMAILLISILALIGITQFTNFSKDAKDNATKANLKILRNGIAAQNGMMRIRCNVVTNAYPPVGDINANDITTSMCTTTQVPVLNDRLFVQTGIPVNPWGPGPTNTIVQADAAAIAGHIAGTAIACTGGGAILTTSDGWCYDSASGNIWANSAKNDGAGAATGKEYKF